VAPAETVKIIVIGVGVGDGEGEGVGEGVGVGVGVGVGANWARAEDTTPMARMKTKATSRAHSRPAPIFSARDAQRMNFIPEKSARSKNAQQADPPGPDLRRVLRERQLVAVPDKG